MKKQSILDKLKDGIVLGDGGYLFELEHRGYVQAGPYTPEVALENPEALRQLHEEFKRCGADVLQALTFYGSQEKLKVIGQGDRVEELNRAAVKIAREVAGFDLLVAGTITQTLSFVPNDRKARDQAMRTLQDQIEVLASEEIDFFIGETFIYLEEALLALELMGKTGLPVMLTMVIGPLGSKDGFSPNECAKRLVENGADILGVNCSFDPNVSLLTISEMRKGTKAYVACQPIGYRTRNPELPFTEIPEFPLALEPIQLTRFDFYDFALKAKELGVNYIGACCGAAPYHIRSMAEALGRRPLALQKSEDLTRHVFDHIQQKDLSYWKAQPLGSEKK